MTKLNNDAFAGSVSQPQVLGVDWAEGPDQTVHCTQSLAADGTTVVAPCAAELGDESVHLMQDHERYTDGPASTTFDLAGVSGDLSLCTDTLDPALLAQSKLKITPNGFVSYADPAAISLPGHYYRHDDDTFIKVTRLRYPYSNSGRTHLFGQLPEADIDGYAKRLVCGGSPYPAEWGLRVTGPIMPPAPGPSRCPDDH